MNDRLEQAKALASAARLSILDLLKEPYPHFAHQESGDPAEIGVCVTLLTAKLGLSQPTVSRHLELLKRAGFLSARNIGRWSYFTRNEDGIRDYKEWLHDTL
ncbi:metalloregulator ArsR/SmtB family transcription factor [Nisaea sp.]|uniref:ArsR/SmtB family transcription factor n=1 Tax=Nisaea sp. TaxID=2024842 RepID=UPI003298BFEE